MRYYVDTEFYEDGHTIEPISIGIVAEDGRELYVQSSRFSPLTVSPWVREHVLPHLVLCPHAPYASRRSLFGDHIAHFQRGQCTFSYREEEEVYPYPNCFWRTPVQMRQEIETFLAPEQYGPPELWGYYSAYDHVLVCQLFGTMMDLPAAFPRYTKDIKQWCDQLGNPRLPQQVGEEHHALADARWNKEAWHFLHTYSQQNARNLECSQ